MYVILVNPDNTLYGSIKQRVMQRSKLVNNLKFVVDPIYNDIDMTDATVVMEYVLPVSREYKTINLVLSEEKYNDCFLQYELPFDTDLTSQAGSLELQLTFVYVEIDEYGRDIQRVRKTSPTTIEIIPITAWSDIVPDSALSALDERLIKLDAQMRGLNDYMNVLDNNQVDNLIYNEVDETLQLSAKGVGVGDKVALKAGNASLEDGVPVVDFSNTAGSTTPEEDEEDNVVEF